MARLNRDFDNSAFETVRMVFLKHNIMFSKSKSASLVGGESRLLKLIGEGKIRADKPTLTQNGKWYCLAADVIRYLKL